MAANGQNRREAGAYFARHQRSLGDRGDGPGSGWLAAAGVVFLVIVIGVAVVLWAGEASLPGYNDGPGTPAHSSGAELCFTGDYGRGTENLWREFERIGGEVVEATHAQDVEKVQALQIQFRDFHLCWNALDPPACAEEADRAMRKAWVSYRMMLRAWLGGTQAELDAAGLEWQEMWKTAVDQYDAIILEDQSK